MIKINIYCVGTLKENYLKEALEEYKKRLSKYAKLEIIEIKEARVDEANIVKGLNEEGDNILKRIKDGEYVILSDLHGKELSSEEFAKEIKSFVDKGISPIDFIIGGTYGLSDGLRKRSNERICLSKLTFTHQMTRVILLEQIYRAFKIINNENYHH